MTESDQNGNLGRTSPPGPDGQRGEPLDFDPYRYGKPDFYVAPEYRPPGYQAPDPEPQQGGGYTPLPPYASTPDRQPPPAPSPPGGYPYPGVPQQQPYPPPYGAGYRQAGNAKATAGLVLGIVSIALCFLTIIDVVFVVLAIVFGALGRRDANRLPDAAGRGRATAGIVCGVVGGLLVAVILVVLVSRYSECFRVSPADVQACVDKHS